MHAMLIISSRIFTLDFISFYFEFEFSNNDGGKNYLNNSN